MVYSCSSGHFLCYFAVDLATVWLLYNCEQKKLCIRLYFLIIILSFTQYFSLLNLLACGIFNLSPFWPPYWKKMIDSWSDCHEENTPNTWKAMIQIQTSSLWMSYNVNITSLWVGFHIDRHLWFWRSLKHVVHVYILNIYSCYIYMRLLFAYNFEEMHNFTKNLEFSL